METVWGARAVCPAKRHRGHPGLWGGSVLWQGVVCRGSHVSCRGSLDLSVMVSAYTLRCLSRERHRMAQWWEEGEPGCFLNTVRRL